jgi:hypothetical protein
MSSPVSKTQALILALAFYAGLVLNIYSAAAPMIAYDIQVMSNRGDGEMGIRFTITNLGVREATNVVATVRVSAGTSLYGEETSVKPADADLSAPQSGCTSTPDHYCGPVEPRIIAIGRLLEARIPRLGGCVSIRIDAFGNSTGDFGTSIDQLTVISDQGLGRSFSPAVHDDLTLNQLRIIGSALVIIGFPAVYLVIKRHERTAHKAKEPRKGQTVIGPGKARYIWNGKEWVKEKE